MPYISVKEPDGEEATLFGAYFVVLILSTVLEALHWSRCSQYQAMSSSQPAPMCCSPLEVEVDQTQQLLDFKQMLISLVEVIQQESGELKPLGSS